jgi:hypothetical protein
VYTKRLITAVAVIIALSTVANAGNTQRSVQTLTGTYVCLVCELEKVEGARCQCDVYGHQYCLRLGDGRYVTFLPNDHGVDLIKGGGRKNFTMKVTGLYNPQSRTIDVHSYVIDGIKTMWNAEHARMEMCSTNQTKSKDKDKGKDKFSVN